MIAGTTKYSTIKYKKKKKINDPQLFIIKNII